ncbi:GNAT family N-acetyltransferase [Gordonia humi]|uniref:Putative acetyltransferase n=1 Tax=Gordonia humi TaxID=686429 RepID=A0A840F398_9ACTN|nr:putative acetyltransferase [Gordonia humi]
MEPLTIRPVRGPDEYPALVEIWRSAVRATHHFLAEDDFRDIENRLASDYFPAVTLIVAEREGTPVGFAGVSGRDLAMLFVHDDARGTGVGKALLAETIANHDVFRVDVNEQNPHALEFYLRQGFEQYAHSEADDDGRPYPVLHLAFRGTR